MTFTHLHFDQYQRYQFTKIIVDFYRELYFGSGHKFSILDVGGLGVTREGKNWLPMKQFLPIDDVTIIDTPSVLLEGYIQGDGTSLPFQENEFDIVMTNDVYEHIPAHLRAAFCDELNRVSKHLVILTAPFYTPTNALAENLHYENLLNQLNVDHQMLGEHLTNGTPDLKWTIDYFKRKGKEVYNYGTGNTYNWVLFSFIKESLGTSNEVIPSIQWIDQYINENLFDDEMIVEPAYRQTIITAKQDISALNEKLLLRFMDKAESHKDLSLLLQMFLQLNHIQQQNAELHKLFYSLDEPEHATRPLKEGDVIELDFFVDEANLSKISFLTGTHGKRQKAFVNVSLFLNGKKLFQRALEGTQIKDNDWVTISFPPIQLNEANIKIQWEFIGEVDPGISLWCNKHSGFLYTLNGKIEEGQPCIKLYKRNFSLGEGFMKLQRTLERKHSQLNDMHSNILKNVSQLKDELKEVVIHELRSSQSKESEAAIADKERHIQNLENHIKAMEATFGWRLFEKLRKIRNFLILNKWRSVGKVKNKIKERGVKGTIDFLNEKLDHTVSNKDYDRWFRERIPNDDQISFIREKIDGFNRKPLISIVMPTYNTEEIWLRKAIDSVRNQIYEKWELCICDDQSPNPIVWKILEEYAALDNRIKITRAEENVRIAGATNKAIELATGEYVGFLDHDDELTIDALYYVVNEINENDPDMIYSDEDKLEMDGTYSDPFFKPDWSPDYLMSTNYICHFSVYKKEIGDSLGWISQGFEGAQDYDFVLKFTERATKINHISRVLYHWRKIPGSTADSFSAKSYAQDAGKKAVESALSRRNIIGTVKNTKLPGHYKVVRKIRNQPLVSIIIPTKDKVELLKKCITSIKDKTQYENYEIIVINNRSEMDETFEYFREMEGDISIIDFDEPFNYSRMNNYAVTKANGTFVLFLNNDTEVINPEWLSAMVEHAVRDEVGVVGSKLLYTDDTIQHGGVILGVGGVANHAFLHLSQNADGYFGMLNDIRNCSAVTAACMLLRREVFEKVGGFDEKNLPVAFNDVDLCLKVTNKNYLCVWTPYSILYHHESATRSREVDPREVNYMRNTWARELDNDPYYNKNFDRQEVIKSYQVLSNRNSN